MLRNELAELLQELREVGSDLNRVEAKRAETDLPRRLWETLSAFANTPGGGIVLLGVDEEHDFAVSGVRDPGKLQADLASLCDQMEPLLRPLIEVHDWGGQALITAEIPEVPPDQKPCYYRGAGLMTGSFLRVADGDRRLTQYEIQVFLDNHGQPRYDLSPVPGHRLEDLDATLLQTFLNRLRQKPAVLYRDWDDHRLLQTFRVITEQEGQWVPTLAGYLCFSPYPQEEFPGLYLSVVQYPTPRAGETGPQGERLLDSVKVEGPLVQILLQGLAAVRRLLKTRTVVQGLLREDVPEYPLEFLREAVVNALAHRDYSPLARGTPVQVRLFPDRLEVANPGGLFGPVTLERLGEPGLQATRNASLLKILEDLPEPNTGRFVCENRGTGIVTMLETLRRAGMEPPDFQDDRTLFRLVATNAALLDEDTLHWLNEFIHVPLNDSQRIALAYARRRQRLTHADYRRLNPALDSAMITRELSELVRAGLLRQHGVRRWTFYTLAVPASAASQSVEGPQRADHREDLLRLLREQGPLPTRELASALGLSEPAIRRWLRVLREEGQVEITTDSPKSRLVRYRVTETGPERSEAPK